MSELQPSYPVQEATGRLRRGWQPVECAQDLCEPTVSLFVATSSVATEATATEVQRTTGDCAVPAAGRGAPRQESLECPVQRPERGRWRSAGSTQQRLLNAGT